MSNHAKSLIDAFIAEHGSQAKAAAAAGVSQPVMFEASKTGRCGPKLANGIDAATGGRISRADLRPDIFAAPAVAASSPSPEAAA